MIPGLLSMVHLTVSEGHWNDYQSWRRAGCTPIEWLCGPPVQKGCCYIQRHLLPSTLSAKCFTCITNNPINIEHF